MRYLPKSPQDREEMLADIGVDNIDSLFATIPAEYQLTRDLNVPRQHGESEIIDRFPWLRRNITRLGYASFLGAGVYKHYKPVIIDSLVQRGEFLTSYTPYQPEIAQGTLQAMFEFQTMICELTGMEIANASMYDGSTGAAEAIMMAVRVTGRNAAVIARTVHPEYREVIQTYATHQEIPLTEVSYASNGRVDMAALEAAVNQDTACVLIQSPNFFGTIEDVAAIAELAHSKGALLIVSIAEAISLGIVKPPKLRPTSSRSKPRASASRLATADPTAASLPAKKSSCARCPAASSARPKTSTASAAIVLTLSTREQHIRREKATSNICTNQALVALMTTIFLTIYGKQGMKELAEHNLAKADYLRSVLADKGKVLFDGAPRFHEFVLDLKQGAEAANEGAPREEDHRRPRTRAVVPELGPGASLWCATRSHQTHRHGRRRGSSQSCSALSHRRALLGQSLEPGHGHLQPQSSARDDAQSSTYGSLQRFNPRNTTLGSELALRHIIPKTALTLDYDWPSRHAASDFSLASATVFPPTPEYRRTPSERCRSAKRSLRMLTSLKKGTNSPSPSLRRLAMELQSSSAKNFLLRRGRRSDGPR